MTSHATPRFWAAYRGLPPEIKKAARRAYHLFRENPRHPGLQSKRVHDRDPIYSIRATLGYRALGLLGDDEIGWFWIGQFLALLGLGHVSRKIDEVLGDLAGRHFFVDHLA